MTMMLQRRPPFRRPCCPFTRGNFTFKRNRFENISHEETLMAMNQQIVDSFTPVFVILTLCLIIGLFGNPLVVAFYGFRKKQTACYMLIATLACFETLSCLVSLPLDIYDLANRFILDNDYVCVLLKLTNNFTNFGSAAVLIAIAVDRFRKLYTPFKRQMTIKITAAVIMISVSFAMISSGPTIYLYRFMDKRHHRNITVKTCSVNPDYRVYLAIYNYYCYSVFTITIVVLGIFYTLMGWKLFQTKKKIKKYQASEMISSTESQVCASVKHKSMISGTETTSVAKPSLSTEVVKNDNDDKYHDGNVDLHLYKRHRGSSLHTIHVTDTNIMPKRAASCNTIEEMKYLPQKYPLDDNACMERNKNNDKCNIVGSRHKKEPAFDQEPVSHTDSFSMSQGTGSSKVSRLLAQKKKRSRRHHTRKFTLISLAISVAFILSYLPYLFIIGFKSFSPKANADLRTEEGIVIFHIFIRSNYFHIICNPIVYGVLNSDFRRRIRRTLKQIC